MQYNISMENNPDCLIVDKDLVAKLSYGSGKEVLVECPVCHKQRFIQWRTVVRNGRTLCHACAAGEKRIDLTGHKYGRLTVVKLDKVKSKHQRTYWVCRCNCGNTTTVRSDTLGNPTTSCGCYQSTKTNRNRQWNNSLQALPLGISP